jgi:hypothetical protein
MQTNLYKETLNFNRHIKFFNMLYVLRYDLLKYVELKKRRII